MPEGSITFFNRLGVISTDAPKAPERLKKSEGIGRLTANAIFKNGTSELNEIIGLRPDLQGIWIGNEEGRGEPVLTALENAWKENERRYNNSPREQRVNGEVGGIFAATPSAEIISSDFVFSNDQNLELTPNLNAETVNWSNALKTAVQVAGVFHAHPVGWKAEWRSLSPADMAIVLTNLEDGSPVPTLFSAMSNGRRYELAARSTETLHGEILSFTDYVQVVNEWNKKLEERVILFMRANKVAGGKRALLLQNSDPIVKAMASEVLNTYSVMCTRATNELRQEGGLDNSPTIEELNAIRQEAQDEAIIAVAQEMIAKEMAEHFKLLYFKSDPIDTRKLQRVA